MITVHVSGLTAKGDDEGAFLRWLRMLSPATAVDS
jgi:hypothetical protein